MQQLIRSLALLLLNFLSCEESFCQYYFYNEDYYDADVTWQLGLSAGGMNCLTDLGGKNGYNRKFIKDVNWSATRPSGGFYAGANYHNMLGAKLELASGQITATDDILKNQGNTAVGRYQRNLNFRSEIKELSFTLECYPLSVLAISDDGETFLNPYIFSGIGYFSFNPETFYKNSWHKLAPFHTEGQDFTEYPARRKYSLKQYNMPLGIGLKHHPSPVVDCCFEICYRKLWTDYLDDVSSSYVDPVLFAKYFAGPKANLAAQLADRRLSAGALPARQAGEIRGNNTNNDTYFTFHLKIGIVLGRQKIK